MTGSTHFVSLRTYALAFAVALSPALMQTSGSCTPKTGDTTLTTLEMEVGGQNHISNFDPALRMYDAWLPLDTTTALVRAYSTDPGSEVSYNLWVGNVSIESGSFPTGGGEITLGLLPEGASLLYVTVTAPGLAQASYVIDMQVGCSDCDDGNDCTADTCAFVDEVCVHNLSPAPCTFSCTEQGILDAIAAGGGPHTFDCDGPTTVTTADEILIDNDVILDGGGLLTIDGDHSGHAIFSVFPDVTAELRGFAISGGGDAFCVCGGRGCCFASRGAVENAGALTLVGSSVSGNVSGIHIHNGSLLTMTDTTVSANGWYGIANGGEAIVVNSTVSSNAWSYPDARGIYNPGTLTLANSTVSTNGNADIENVGTLTLTNSTVSAANEAWGILNLGTATVANSTLSTNGCSGYGGSMTSLGHNIESPGDTCGFDRATDQVDVTAAELNLGPLTDNGGPTMTHALLPGSVAIDVIPEAACVDADGQPLTTDQRGVTRPQGIACDVGAFEYASSGGGGGCCGWGR